MPDFSLALNEDQLTVQKWVHEFAERTIRPAAAEWDEREETPWPVIQEAAKIGLYSWDAMAQFFADPTGLTMGLVNEEMFWGDAGIGLAIFGSCLGVAGIIGNGTPEQIMTWVPQCFGTPDDVKLAAFCVTEPRRRLRRVVAAHPGRAGRLRLGPQRHEVLHHQRRHRRRPRGRRHHRRLPRRPGPGLLRGPAGTPGLSQGKKERKMGIRASHTAEVVLDDVPHPVRVPARWRARSSRPAWPGPGRAPRPRRQAAMRTFEASRPIVGAQAVGIARAAYEFALDYAKERNQFGRAIIENQAIAFMLADMATEIDAARLLVHRALWLARNGDGYQNAEGSMSKLKAGRVAVWVTERAIQILGGYGYIRDFPVERWHRDAKIYDIFEGTEQIQQLVISRAISGVHIR